MAKPFADKANANAAAIQAAADYAASQLQATAKFQAAKAKIGGQLQQSLFDHHADAAQAQFDAQHDAATSQMQGGVPEDVVGPTIQPVAAPMPSGNVQATTQGQFTIDPSQVQGGAAIQAATGGMGRAAPPTPQVPTYNVPPTITTQQQTTGQEYVNSGPGYYAALPHTTTTTSTRPNVMTPGEAAQLQLQQRQIQQQAVFEQQRLTQSARQVNLAAAADSARTWGERGAQLTAKLAAGLPLEPSDFAGAGKTIAERQAEAGISASNQQTAYYKHQLEMADKTFELQRTESIARLAQTLGATGGAVNSSNLPLNNAMGVTDNQVPGGMGGKAAIAQTLQQQLGEYGQTMFGGSTGAGLMKVATSKLGGYTIEPLEFFLKAGAPAAALNQVVVRQYEPTGIVYGALGAPTKPTGFTTVPMETFMAEWLAAHGKVPTLTTDRIKEAKERLDKWGYIEPTEKGKPFNEFMRYTWAKVDQGIQEYRGTIVEQNALKSLGVQPRTVTGDQVRLLPSQVQQQQLVDQQREINQRNTLGNLDALEEFRKRLAASQQPAQ